MTRDGMGDNYETGFDRIGCKHCGYDLRGSDAGVCPECGHAVEIILATFKIDDPSFHALMTRLAAEGVRYRGIGYDHVHQEEAFSSGIQSLFRPIAVLVPRDEFDRASAMYEEVIQQDPVPIVDRNEPVCPYCEQSLDPSLDDPCPSCGGVYTLVDIAALTDQLDVESGEDIRDNPQPADITAQDHPASVSKGSYEPKDVGHDRATMLLIRINLFGWLGLFGVLLIHYVFWDLLAVPAQYRLGLTIVVSTMLAITLYRRGRRKKASPDI
jgi:hypothetical protein